MCIDNFEYIFPVILLLNLNIVWSECYYPKSKDEQMLYLTLSRMGEPGGGCKKAPQPVFPL